MDFSRFYLSILFCVTVWVAAHTIIKLVSNADCVNKWYIRKTEQFNSFYLLQKKDILRNSLWTMLNKHMYNVSWNFNIRIE